ncbi:hypothetical protein GE21DRAFT_2383 [Neurospora crassa]|uniref:RING-type domain-containing protein n=1 Tax=Neurospora crassa (strain ATCC 24698 / 74-OR23-1A / CBS 708.71 / DSM 1257 / FGSC 987) TaxID=367110 RepID=Q7SHJ0_NEUCR|nr:hypothetical protein NCU02914 [Neurospora crassa OR74A]EAA36360.2 hypothetical protein NCU02914 [Neurospora crassa OR74A]KHE89313.1 hypothetical protein GE21DRAFT_2383 [Neurospora crassa]|eukprot:XP_965596.2 hypothetical protein NCU02914 [Neurospora crassa OR74A]
MDGINSSRRSGQGSSESFSSTVTENISKDYMSGSPTMENRQISGVGVTFGPGMEVYEVKPEIAHLPYYEAESKRVNVYWGRQFLKYTIKMNHDPSSLLAIHTLFLSGEIKVRGKLVTTQYSSSGPGSGTLELLELPPDVFLDEITRQIPPELLKDAQWTTKQPKFLDSYALTAVLLQFSKFGPLKEQEVETLPTMMRVSTLFQNENDARRAVEVLNQSTLPLDPQQMLMARLEYEMMFKGPEKWVQNTLKQLLSKASFARNTHQMKLVVHSLDDEPHFSLSGESCEVLVEAMEVVRQLPVYDQIHEDRLNPGGFIAADECCVICGDTAESPVITQCKHVYCGNCFHNLCSSTFSVGSWRNRVVCQAPKPSGTSTVLDNSICGRTLGLPEIQTMVKTNTFERLLTASFKSYVQGRPHRLQNCPTTDCDYVYVVPEPNDNLVTAPHITCPHCLVDICTRCQKGHAARGMTCLEFQDHLAHGEHSMALAKAEQGIQDCPKCTILLVKVHGCNHVTCPACHTHMCWLCLEMFEGEAAPERVYDHLVVVHGGIFDEGDDDEYVDYLGDDDEDDDEDEDLDDDGDGGDDDDNVDWEQEHGFGGEEAALVLVHLIRRLLRLLGQLQAEGQRRNMGDAADPNLIEEGQGEQADTGQEDNRDNDEDANVDGDNAANQEDIEVEDEQVALRAQGAPEAIDQDVWLFPQIILLEREPFEEPRVQPNQQERRDWEEIVQPPPQQRMDWEEIDVIAPDIVYNFDFFIWLLFFIVGLLWNFIRKLALFALSFAT